MSLEFVIGENRMYRPKLTLLQIDTRAIFPTHRRREFENPQSS